MSHAKTALFWSSCIKIKLFPYYCFVILGDNFLSEIFKTRNPYDIKIRKMDGKIHVTYQISDYNKAV